MRNQAALLTALACVLHAPAARAAPSTSASPKPASPDVAAIAAHYQAWLKLHPLEATELGLHSPALDAAMPELGPVADRAVLAQLAAGDQLLEQASRATGCDERCRVELEIVRFHVEAERHTLARLRPFERYADAPIDVVARAVFPLIKRDFAPLPSRAAYAIARLQAAPRVFEQALALLRGSTLVAKVSIDIALEQLPSTADFLERDVPAAFASLPDASLVRRVREAGKRAADALRAYGKALSTEIAPRATPSFSLGEPLFVELLAKQEMITEPLPQLRARGEAELRRLQSAFREVAHRIDPKQEPLAVQRALGRDHAAAGAIIAEVRGRLASLRRFVVEHDLVGIPSEVMPIVDETPPFMRATTQASMDTPGPYEPRATEAYYHVTLPDPHWDAARTDDYLGGAFNRAIIDVVSIHEALPGHYVQLLWMQHLSSQARRMQGNGAYIEGWAHYCEEMMLDEGWGGVGEPDRRADRVRLAQLADALLRAARYVVAIRMHTGGMTLAEAQRFFEVEGLQSHEVALIEAKRGTEDPMFLHYTWGKLELKALREALRGRWGKSFSLRRFHDAVLAEGPVPLPILRRLLLK